IMASGWSAAYFVEDLSIDKGRAALMLSLFWLGLSIGRWAVGTFMKAVSPIRVVAVSMSVGAAG
ncbi:MAG: hypothetical protein R3282_10110, partial [Rhodothermales bacterium]|nr:hypothetical protein [Rhodothermales bacterium]